MILNRNWFYFFTLIYGVMILAFVFLILHFNIFDFGLNEKRNLKCYFDLLRNKQLCHESCMSKKMFILPPLKECQPILKCKDILKGLKKVQSLHQDEEREVSIVTWNDVRLVKSSFKYPEKQGQNSKSIKEDDPTFYNQIKMLQWFQGSPYVVKFVGSCDYHTIITKYYELGNMENIFTSIRLKSKLQDSLQVRFILIINYLKLLNFFHTHEPGPFALCVNGNIKSYMSKFLVDSDFRIVFNGLESLGLVDDRSRYTCKPSSGKMAAPEELGTIRVRVTEKRDIWRIPFVSEFIFGKDGFEAMRPYLSEIDERCQSTDPSDRPSASEVLKAYVNVSKLLSISRSHVGKVLEF